MAPKFSQALRNVAEKLNLNGQLDETLLSTGEYDISLSQMHASASTDKRNPFKQAVMLNENSKEIITAAANVKK